MKTGFSIAILLPSGGSTSTGEDDIVTAKARLAELLCYYQTECNYAPEAIDYELTEDCLECGGSGKIRKPYKRLSDRLKHQYDMSQVVCPACKGVNSSRVLIPLNPK